MTQRIAEIIAEYMDKDVADINVEDTFSNIGLDSLDIMELVMQIEDEFDCKIELNQELNTITKLAEYIEAQK
ncbi:MAG TPA: acyl carrier protein [Lachnospiraceae bacterium]|nr:acyl carrier protein [Lachnospiraceae bacterium]